MAKRTESGFALCVSAYISALLPIKYSVKVIFVSSRQKPSTLTEKMWTMMTDICPCLGPSDRRSKLWSHVS